MRKLILIIVFFAGFSRVYAAAATESSNQSLRQPLDSSKLLLADWFLVWSPTGMLIISVIAINLGTKNFKLEEALTENEYAKITQVNPEFNTENLDKIKESLALVSLLTPTIQVSDTAKGLPKSSSRYLALITTALSLAIAACLSSLFIYAYILTGSQPDINHLGDVLVALGLGVTPYAINKVSTAVSSKS